MQKVETLGSLWESTNEAVLAAQNIVRAEKQIKVAKEEKEAMLSNSTLYKMNEVKQLLKKAGINLKYFPFKPIKNKQGEIEGFVPKGKNEMEIKEDIASYKEKLEEALENGKITQEEYDELQENLDELMKENEIEIENEEEKLEVNDEQINDTLNAIIYRCFGDNYDLNGIKESYEESSLDDKKVFLTKFNSEINKKIGIAGDLKFVNKDLEFEDSFSYKGNGGYFLSTNDINVEGKDLKGLLYGMVERSMLRKAEIKKEKIMTPEQKSALHEKVMREKQKREREEQRQEEKRNREKARKLIRTMDGKW